jgi:hypothetical protein
VHGNTTRHVWLHAICRLIVVLYSNDQWLHQNGMLLYCLAEPALAYGMMQDDSIHVQHASIAGHSTSSHIAKAAGCWHVRNIVHVDIIGFHMFENLTLD